MPSTKKTGICPSCQRESRVLTNEYGQEVWAYHDRHPLLKALCPASKRSLATLPPIEDAPPEGSSS